MYLLLAALVSTSAHATEYNPPSTFTFGQCGFKPPPCEGGTKFLDTDGSIIPGDWYAAEYEELGGNLNYYRVEIYAYRGSADVTIGSYYLDEKWFVPEESGRGVTVYYVPAERDAEIFVDVTSREGAYFDIVIDGSEKSPF